MVAQLQLKLTNQDSHNEVSGFLKLVTNNDSVNMVAIPEPLDYLIDRNSKLRPIDVKLEQGKDDNII